MSEVDRDLLKVASEKLRSKGAYVKPAIVYELDLETRAGTPVGPYRRVNGLDPLGLDPTNNPR
jgi:hypothetical protein